MTVALLKDVDTQMGMTVRGVTHDIFKVLNRETKFIDIIDAPELTLLDISRVTDAVHLTLRDCPKLQKILLPKAKHGSVLHLDLGRFDGTVHIAGAVRHIDFCSQKRAPFTFTNEEPLQSMLIAAQLNPDAFTHIDMMAHDCLALLGNAHKAHDVTNALFMVKHVRALHLDGLSLSRVEVASPKLSQLSCVSLPLLKEISTTADLSRVEITDCKNLAQLTASGKTLRIKKSCSEHLNIHGFWESAVFEDVTGSVCEEFAKQIDARRCLRIQPDQFVLNNATDPLRLLPRPEAINDEAWQVALMRCVAATTQRQAVLPALKVLIALVKAGVAAKHVNAHRLALHRNQQPHIRAVAAPRVHTFMVTGKWNDTDFVWSWPDTDLEVETYIADLELLAELHDAGEDLSHILDGMLPLLRLEQVSAILKFLATHQEAKFADHLIKQCHRIFGRNPRKILECRQGSTKARFPMFRAILDAGYSLRLHERTEFAFTGMADFISANLSPDLAFSPLRGLMHLGVDRARAVLDNQARTLQAQGHPMAGVYRAASLEPVKSDLLAAI